MSEHLAEEMKGLSLQQHNRRRKRRDYYAYASLGAEQQPGQQTQPAVSPLGSPNIGFDPNAAANSAGIGYPSTTNMSQYMQSAQFPGAGEVDPGHLQQQQPEQQQQQQQQQYPQQYSSQQQYQSAHPQAPMPQIQQQSQAISLSVPVVRFDADKYYVDKQFRTFENVSPPPAGTQYEVVDQGNASPKFSLMSMYSVPASGELLKSTAMPLGMLLRPFADHAATESFESIDASSGDTFNEYYQVEGESGPNASEGKSKKASAESVEAVPESDFSRAASVPRCRRCRAYVNPAMQHTGYQMICNLCGFTSPVPTDYTASVDGAGVRSDFYQRPELHSGVYDMRVPQEYNIDPEKPAGALQHVFLVDTSLTAVKSGFTGAACTAIEMSLYGQHGKSLPKGSNVAIVGFDSRLKFFDLSPTLREAKVAVVGDLGEPFVPFAGTVFGPPVESQDIISASLERLQSEPAVSDQTALGSALKAADLLLEPCGGGLVTVLVGSVPTLSPGPLRPKLPPQQGLRGMAAAEYARDVLTPGSMYYTDELEKLYVKHQVGVNFFVGTPSPVDLVNLEHLSTRTGGITRLWSHFMAERDELDLANTVQRSVRSIAGYQAQIKIRCSRGLQVSSILMCGRKFPGNDGVCANLPIVGPDSSIACSFTYDGKLNTKKDAHFQAALLYTDAEGVRRVRVINTIMSVTERVADVFSFANSDAILALLVRDTLSKFPEDTSMVSLRNILAASVVSIVSHYANLVGNGNSAPGELLLPRSLSTLPMHVLGVLKTRALLSRVNAPDRRVNNFYLLSTADASLLSLLTYPAIFALHRLQPEECEWHTVEVVGNDQDEENTRGIKSFNLPQATQLSQTQLETGGAYLAFDGEQMILWLHTQVSVQFLHDLFGSSVDSIDALDPQIVQLPNLDTALSKQVRELCEFLSMHFLGLKTHSVHICRFKMDPSEAEFLQLMYEDRSNEMVWSYSEFLRYLHKRVQQLHVESPKPNGKRFGLF